MNRITLSIAVGDYDRVRALVDGRVMIEAVDPIVLTLTPEEIFFRAFRHSEFDVCELSLSGYVAQLAAGGCDYVAIPAFPSRAFRHNALYVRTDRIRHPKDLIGRRVGVPEYQITAAVWVRAILADDYGVEPRDLVWVRGGVDAPGRHKSVAISLPGDIRIEEAGADRSLSDLMVLGEIDAILAPQRPACADTSTNVGWLFPNPKDAAIEYFRRTRIFPIMHVVAVRKTLAERHPWLPAALFKAFCDAKSVALVKLAETGTNKATLPFIEADLIEARALMGQDFWSYGLPAARDQLEVFLDHHHRQGLSVRRVRLEELFHPSTCTTFQH